MLKLLEPALLVVMGSIVALFVFALIMPILRSSSLVG
jgi:type II secretory pathway component PulF